MPLPIVVFAAAAQAAAEVAGTSVWVYVAGGNSGCRAWRRRCLLLQGFNL